MKMKIKCAECGEPIEPGEECVQVTDGQINEEGGFVPKPDPDYYHVACF